MTIDNKLGITDSFKLANEEERISKKKAIDLFQTDFMNELKPGSLEALVKIHRHLFEDIYEFAGQLRTVNIAKGNFRFAPTIYLNEALKSIEKMPQSTFDEIIEKYVEMNIAHPFREGNGRSARIWLDLILKSELKKVVDWSKVDKDDYLLAMERSPVKDIEIKTLLFSALTDKTDDREVLTKEVLLKMAGEGGQAPTMLEAERREKGKQLLASGERVCLLFAEEVLSAERKKGSFLFCVRTGQTHGALIEHRLAKLMEEEIPVKGLLLFDADLKFLNRYYGTRGQ